MSCGFASLVTGQSALVEAEAEDKKNERLLARAQESLAAYEFPVKNLELKQIWTLLLRKKQLEDQANKEEYKRQASRARENGMTICLVNPRPCSELTEIENQLSFLEESVGRKKREKVEKLVGVIKRLVFHKEMPSGPFGDPYLAEEECAVISDLENKQSELEKSLSDE
jgi:hypothetical protein